jgi:hypothetical protein
VTETITRLLVHTAPSAYSQASRGFAIQGGKMIPVLMIVAATIALFIVERVFPGRDRPEARNWYARAGFLQSVTRQFRSFTLRVLDRSELCSNVGQLL